MQARFEHGAVCVTTRSGVQSFWMADLAELQLFRSQLDQAMHQLSMHKRKVAKYDELRREAGPDWPAYVH